MMIAKNGLTTCFREELELEDKGWPLQMPPLWVCCAALGPAGALQGRAPLCAGK